MEDCSTNQKGTTPQFKLLFFSQFHDHYQQKLQLQGGIMTKNYVCQVHSMSLDKHTKGYSNWV